MAREVGVGAPQGGRHCVCTFRNCNQVNVIGHETIRPQPQPGLLGMSAQQVQIETIILGVKEDLLPAIASLGDMIRNVFQDNPGDSRHPTDSGADGFLVSNCV